MQKNGKGWQAVLGIRGFRVGEYDTGKMRVVLSLPNPLGAEMELLV